MPYMVEVWRGHMLVWGFAFETVAAPTPCHFVGAGTIGISRDPRVAFGMNVHNDLDLQNILAVVWGRNYFWLDTLTAVEFVDDPTINPSPPPARFDTLHGRGVGRYNGASGYQAEFIFTDAGEPGKVDWAWIRITASNGDTVMEVSGFLRFGNIQALDG
jgi:hypothetical protein